MSIQVLERVSGDTALTTFPDDPVGVSRERVDSYTLTVVDQLFPSPTCGVGFLALLLRLACVKQLSLEMEHEEPQTSVAVISVQSIKQLAALIGWSYESTHKYVVLFCALGLLIKRRNRGMVELHFPLNRYTPPTLDALDTLIEQYRYPKRKGKTDKRLKHAERVKQRFLLLYGTRTSTALPPALHVPETVTAHAVPDLTEAIGEVADLLTHIPENLPYSEQLASVLHRLQRAQEQLAEIHYTTSPGVSTPGRLSATQVDSSVDVATRKGRFVATQVDSSPASTALVGRLSATQVDSSDQQQDNREEASSQKSTQNLSEQAQTGRLPASQVDFSAKKVDSDLASTSNVNVITIIESINVNVSMVALFCCKALGEAPGKRGIYSKLFREVDFQASAITAALVYTLVHREDGTMRKPQAVFYQRCKDYHQSGVPEEVAALVERYGHLPYPKLLEALRRPPAPVVQPAPQVRREVPTTSRTPASLPPLTNARVSLAPRISLKTGGGMRHEDAHRLRAQIAGDRRVGLCRTGVVPLADGTYAVIVDHTLTEIVRQVAFYSLHEWEMRSTSLTAGHDLFVPEGQEKPHPFRALLRKGEKL